MGAAADNRRIEIRGVEQSGQHRLARCRLVDREAREFAEAGTWRASERVDFFAIEGVGGKAASRIQADAHRAGDMPLVVGNKRHER